ncbi:mammalian cell entry protein [Mycobacterium sp. ITM-2016-00317]|uniref:mammalian cell entry protein n=1 Tax=Mycobacterium sp. ITM-2016-00317 TaxID=2099694 RepID=UPI00287FD0C0|nr:mammalian cell entry protein [Mycobacterium sp. ITM-2016-00317]WNG87887.1 mammalian cell entry protein [Mycobacterium sp. ITM-2016-00317]
MEDQQPGTGDLTTDDPVTRSRRRFFRRMPKAAPEAVPAVDEPAPKVPVGKSRRAARKPAEETPAEETPEAVAETPDEQPEAVTLVPHRPAGRRAVVAVAAASVVFVAASGFAAAMAQPYLVERALYETKLTIARTATDAITTLWTYSPDDMATLGERASAYLSGDFGTEYRRYIDAIVEPNKQAQVTNTTEVMGAAVESVSPPTIPTEATALVYTNSVATSPVTKNIPSLRYLSYRLTMQREGDDWRIVRMSTITSFDLTPQL